MVEIIIPNKRYNSGIANLGEALSGDEITDICMKVTGQTEYKLTLDNNWSTGRFVKVINGEEIHFVGISGRKVEGRNSFVQTIATIFSAFTNFNYNKKFLDFYFLPITGNNLTPYLKFCYRLMKTIKFNFVNPKVGFGSLILEPYSDIIKLIEDRNNLREKNSSNNSSFITDEGFEYRIYGKAFGANSKETALFCFAISYITDKPVKLFQILDNNSDSISQNDKKAIISFKKIEIIDDTFMFDKTKEIPEDNDNIRSARFIYNLLSRYGKKKCVLCGCEISNLISGAHIWPVADIKKAHISLDEKKKYASDSENGIWLCENHHKLFDANLLTINNNGEILLSKKLDETGINFVNYITTIHQVDLSTAMINYFNLRYKKILS